jgi:uncharacterized radical SAM superfamily Fe-S cluster-containing enzyme
VAAEGRAEVVQLSGGEPTLHPQLMEIVEYTLAQPVDYVMINTNGIRLAKDQALVDRLAAHRQRLEVYFQFDSLDDVQLQTLRGQRGLLDIKLQALERLERAGLNVTLVATLQGGVNNQAPAELLELARQLPHVTGLSFQPATYSGRHTLPTQLEQRITFPDVIDSLASDTRNEFSTQDFFPLPCAHPNCHWIALAARSGSSFMPLTQWIDAEANLDLLANGISFTREKAQSIARLAMARMACGDSGCCSPTTESSSAGMLPILDPQAGEPALETFLAKLVEQAVGARDILRITITSFLDVYNFDLRRVMKCCTHHVLPSGHVIPFCAYNVLYRDGTAKLPLLSNAPGAISSPSS